MTGNLALQCAIDRPADLFPDDRPHAATHKTEVEHAEHHTTAIHHPFADHHGIFAAGLPLVRLHTILVRFRVLKVQRVLGTELRIPLFERPEVDQERNTLHDRNREMVVALRADLIITLDFFAIDDFSAVVALEPHPFRNLGSFRRFRLGRFLFFKPGHCALLLVRHRSARHREVLKSSILAKAADVLATCVLAAFGPQRPRVRLGP